MRVCNSDLRGNRLGVMTRLLGSLALLASCAVAQTVEGSVVDSGTGNGIAGVRVEFLQSGKTAYEATTDAKGHFHVEGVKPGAYSARYTCPDYWLSDPGSGRPFQANMGVAREVFQVTAGGNPVKLEAPMKPLPRITGHVIDGRGKGVVDARVELAGAGPGRGRGGAGAECTHRWRGKV
jgi:protocatechuate 3,4-dioxygenase beta subunit